MTASKQKGTAAETAVVAYLRNEFPHNKHIERRALTGALDKGDIAGFPGVVIEVKNHARMTLAEWVNEATIEAGNANALIGVVWHKRKGTTDPANWYVTMPGHVFSALLFAWGNQ